MNIKKPNIYQANHCPPCPPDAKRWEKIIYWLGIGLGSGLAKKAAGTWGTLGGLIIAIPMAQLGFIAFLTLIIISSLIGGFICGKTSNLMMVHDDPHIVFDEWVGMWLTLLPIIYFQSSIDQHEWILWIIAFILFRFFDIIKPFPIRWVDRHLSGGLGILMDDILAGIISAILILLYFI